MQFQGIVFIQLQGNDIVVNFQENIFIQKNIFILFTKNVFIQENYIHSRKLYSSKELPSFKESYPFKENIFIEEIYILSRKYIHSRKLYSLKFKEICSFNNVAFPDIQQVSPATS